MAADESGSGEIQQEVFDWRTSLDAADKQVELDKPAAAAAIGFLALVRMLCTEMDKPEEPEKSDKPDDSAAPPASDTPAEESSSPGTDDS
ncbi:hypothetical protein IID19_00930 [Patescibacteria group bacterium]|nr:hypothetical protein [Patescibacteria group bacterium]